MVNSNVAISPSLILGFVIPIETTGTILLLPPLLICGAGLDGGVADKISLSTNAATEYCVWTVPASSLSRTSTKILGENPKVYPAPSLGSSSVTVILPPSGSFLESSVVEMYKIAFPLVGIVISLGGRNPIKLPV